jgi:tRNA threonylcarbamoyladenosine biosynthesis protein TsaB
MLVLGLDAALASCSAAIIRGDVRLAERAIAGGRGQSAALAPMVQDVLSEAGVAATELDGVAVTIGPGSFTGIRAALSLAHGLALALEKPLVGVTVAEALAEALPPAGARAVWCAIDSRRGRIFLDDGSGARSVALDDLPQAAGPLLLTGDAAEAVAAILVGRGDDAMVSDARIPRAADVARVGARRIAGLIGPLDPQPLYVDPPAARLPAGGLRPAPH